MSSVSARSSTRFSRPPRPWPPCPARAWVDAPEPRVHAAVGDRGAAGVCGRIRSAGIASREYGDEGWLAAALQHMRSTPSTCSSSWRSQEAKYGGAFFGTTLYWVGDVGCLWASLRVFHESPDLAGARDRLCHGLRAHPAHAAARRCGHRSRRSSPSRWRGRGFRSRRPCSRSAPIGSSTCGCRCCRRRSVYGI